MTQDEHGKITEAELIGRLGELPKRVEPRNDPWPQIQQRISVARAPRAGANAPWLRIAAAVAMAFALGIVLGRSWQVDSPSLAAAGQEDAGSGGPPNLGLSLAGAEREYQAAFSEFIRIGQSAENLNSSTLDAIERNWQEMLDAESVLSVALQQDPNNPWLNKRMLELRQHQLAMLKQLAGMDRLSRRTEI